MRMCFNWKVIASLAALCLGIYVVAPGLIASALPVLLVLVCPLSMLLMGGMMGGMGTGRTADVVADTEPVPSRDRQLAELRARLRGLAEQQAALAREIAQVEATGTAAPRRASRETTDVVAGPVLS